MGISTNVMSTASALHSSSWFYSKQTMCKHSSKPCSTFSQIWCVLLPLSTHSLKMWMCLHTFGIQLLKSLSERQTLQKSTGPNCAHIFSIRCSCAKYEGKKTYPRSLKQTMQFHWRCTSFKISFFEAQKHLMTFYLTGDFLGCETKKIMKWNSIFSCS